MLTSEYFQWQSWLTYFLMTKHTHSAWATLQYDSAVIQVHIYEVIIQSPVLMLKDILEPTIELYDPEMGASKL